MLIYELNNLSKQRSDQDRVGGSMIMTLPQVRPGERARQDIQNQGSFGGPHSEELKKPIYVAFNVQDVDYITDFCIIIEEKHFTSSRASQASYLACSHR